MEKDSWDKFLNRYQKKQVDSYVNGKVAMEEMKNYASKRDAAGGYVWTVADMERYFNRKKKR